MAASIIRFALEMVALIFQGFGGNNNGYCHQGKTQGADYAHWQWTKQ
jgi:hypothetical protein